MSNIDHQPLKDSRIIGKSIRNESRNNEIDKKNLDIIRLKLFAKWIHKLVNKIVSLYWNKVH